MIEADEYYVRIYSVNKAKDYARFFIYWFNKAVNSSQPIDLDLSTINSTKFSCDDVTTVYEGIDFPSSIKVLNYFDRYLNYVGFTNADADILHLFIRLVFGNVTFKLSLTKLFDIAILHRDVKQLVCCIWNIVIFERGLMDQFQHIGGISENSDHVELCYHGFLLQPPLYITRNSALTNYDFLKSMTSILNYYEGDWIHLIRKNNDIDFDSNICGLIKAFLYSPDDDIKNRVFIILHHCIGTSDNKDEDNINILGTITQFSKVLTYYFMKNTSFNMNTYSRKNDIPRIALDILVILYEHPILRIDLSTYDMSQALFKRCVSYLNCCTCTNYCKCLRSVSEMLKMIKNMHVNYNIILPVQFDEIQERYKLAALERNRNRELGRVEEI